MNLRKNGPFLFLISNLFFGFLPIMVKWANVLHYSPIEESFFRFVFAVFGVAGLWLLGKSLKPVNMSALLWRGFFGSISILAYFTALQTTTVGKGTLLNYTTTLWANVYAVLLFKHKPPKGYFWILILAGVGLQLVLDVHWDNFHYGDAAGFLSGVTGGAAVLAVKRARHTDNSLTVFASFTVFSFVLSGLLLLANPILGVSTPSVMAWTTPDFPGLMVLLGIGFVAMVAQMFFTEAFGHTSLALGTLLPVMVPIFAALFGRIILGETFTPHFLLGMVLVLSACVLLGWRERVEAYVE
jgi:drug/metabolite transporter (DMT)-like permease